MSWLDRLLDHETPIKTYAKDAQQWDRCAVAEAHKFQPLVVAVRPSFRPDHQHGDPDDIDLRQLGRDFYRAVRTNKRREALRVYFKIQQRVIALASGR